MAVRELQLLKAAGKKVLKKYSYSKQKKSKSRRSLTRNPHNAQQNCPNHFSSRECRASRAAGPRGSLFFPTAYLTDEAAILEKAR